MYDKATSRQLACLRKNGCAFASSDYAVYLTTKEAGVLIGLYKRLNEVERVCGVYDTCDEREGLIDKIRGIQHNAMMRSRMLFN